MIVADKRLALKVAVLEKGALVNFGKRLCLAFLGGVEVKANALGKVNDGRGDFLDLVGLERRGDAEAGAQVEHSGRGVADNDCGDAAAEALAGEDAELCGVGYEDGDDRGVVLAEDLAPRASKALPDEHRIAAQLLDAALPCRALHLLECADGLPCASRRQCCAVNVCICMAAQHRNNVL